jgi:rsbT co-antagonist protein RsbR
MPASGKDTISALLERQFDGILDEWMKRQLAASAVRPDLIKQEELRSDSKRFLAAFRHGVASGNRDLDKTDWSEALDVLTELSRSRAEKGFAPVETAMFVFSLKEPLFASLREALKDDPERLASEVWTTTTLLDKLGLYTMEVFQRSREEIIFRQQKELLELSTPVVKLWDGILALPLVGTLDSARTQVVMESLLQKIVDSGSAIAIIDITGVPTVDTLVAQHLLKTVAATRLMGADCIISGIRPQIAQTIVHLGVDLGEVTTKATLADAFATALERTRGTVSPGHRHAADSD